jgi:hypothetical protein
MVHSIKCTCWEKIQCHDKKKYALCHTYFKQVHQSYNCWHTDAHTHVGPCKHTSAVILMPRIFKSPTPFFTHVRPAICCRKVMAVKKSHIYFQTILSLSYTSFSSTVTHIFQRCYHTHVFVTHISAFKTHILGHEPQLPHAETPNWIYI